MSLKRSLVRAGMAVVVSSFLVLNFGCAGNTTGQASKAAIDIEPPTGKKSTAITINGSGFQPQEEVDIVITLGPGKKVGLGTEKVEVIEADANGNFSVPSAIPMNAKAGEYPIDVEGNKGSVVATKIVVTE